MFYSENNVIPFPALWRFTFTARAAASQVRFTRRFVVLSATGAVRVRFRIFLITFRFLSLKLLLGPSEEPTWEHSEKKRHEMKWVIIVDIVFIFPGTFRAKSQSNLGFSTDGPVFREFTLSRVTATGEFRAAHSTQWLCNTLVPAMLRLKGINLHKLLETLLNCLFGKKERSKCCWIMWLSYFLEALS